MFERSLLKLINILNYIKKKLQYIKKHMQLNICYWYLKFNISFIFKYYIISVSNLSFNKLI